MRMIVGLVVAAAMVAALLGTAPGHSQTFRGLVIALSGGGEPMADAPAVKGPRLGSDNSRWRLFQKASGTVEVAGVWLRGGPSADAERIHALAEGARIEADAGHAEGDVIWWHVRLLPDDPASQVGWIRFDHVSFDTPPPA